MGAVEGSGVPYGRAGAILGEAAGVARYTGPGLPDGIGVGEGTGGGVTGLERGYGVAYGKPGPTGTGWNDGDADGLGDAEALDDGAGDAVAACATSKRCTQLWASKSASARCDCASVKSGDAASAGAVKPAMNANRHAKARKLVLFTP